jgi:pyridoxal phosphate enzyme (YggS family)
MNLVSRAEIFLLSIKYMQNLEKNLLEVQNRIASACENCGREPNSVRLLAVSKRHSVDSIRAAASFGQKDFGENYLQEAQQKQDALVQEQLNWHFIGPLQSNKTRMAAERFSWVHSVDRLKIAQRLSTQRPSHHAPLNICLQLNIDEEESKSGFTIDNLDTAASEISQLSGIRLRGLMVIPRARTNYDEQRRAFAKVRAAWERLKQQLDGQDWDTLSMGMSADLEAAIAEGATIVRIGTALFGERQQKTPN